MTVMGLNAYLINETAVSIYNWKDCSLLYLGSTDDIPPRLWKAVVMGIDIELGRLNIYVKEVHNENRDNAIHDSKRFE